MKLVILTKYIIETIAAFWEYVESSYTIIR